MSIDLGAVFDVGILASDTNKQALVARTTGTAVLSEQEVLDLLKAALLSPARQDGKTRLSASQIITGLNISSEKRESHQWWLQDRRFSELTVLASGPSDPTATSLEGKSIALGTALHAAQSSLEAEKIVFEALTKKAQVLSSESTKRIWLRLVLL